MLISTLALLALQTTTQHIACAPAEDIYSTERLVMSFRFADRNSVPSEGTFYLTSGIDDDGNQETTVKLPLRSLEDPRSPAGVARFAAEDEVGTYTVEISESDLGRATKSMSVNVEFARNHDQGSFSETYRCYASTFE